MIKTETLKVLESTVGFDEMVKVVGMQAIMHSTRIKAKHLAKGEFQSKVCGKFASLLGEDDQSASRAFAGVMACEEYDQRVSLEGLGGCVVIPLDVLLKNETGSMQTETSISGRSLEDLRSLWAKFGDEPVDAEDQLEKPFLHFMPGTHREDVWRWFESQHPQFIVGDEMNQSRHDSRVSLRERSAC